MSNAPISLSNPYAPSAMTGMVKLRPQSALPTFCKTMFIAGLVLSSLRILLFLLGIQGLAILQDQKHPLLPTVPFELATNAAIGVLGIIAAIGLLKKRTWGITLGGLTIAAVIGNMIVAVMQTRITYEMTTDPTQQMVILAAAGVIMLIRIGILLLYAMALRKFSQWKKSLAVAA